MIIKDDFDEIQPYLIDASNFKGHAKKVYIPETISELQKIVKKLYENNEEITISGAGTGLSGGRVPQNGIIISLERMNKIKQIDTDKSFIDAEANTPLKEIQKLAEENGLFYPPNPTENESSIGGNIATNASGSRTFKYGATREFVQRLHIVLANGDDLILDRGSLYFDGFECNFSSRQKTKYNIKADEINMPKIKHAAGYYIKENMDLIDLFIGSEGTLGIIVEARLNLIQAPENIMGCIAFFDSIDNALEYVSDLKKRADKFLSPRLIELFDKKALDLLRNDYSFLPDNSFAAIWTEQEYIKNNEDEVLSNWYNIIKDYTEFSDLTWIALDAKEHKKMTDFRHAIPLKVNDFVSRYNTRKFGTDVSCPDEYLKNLYYEIDKKVLATGLDSVTFGHIGNSHIHANVFTRNQAEIKIAEKFYSDCIDIALSLGGTVSAEHGIGKLKTAYLERMFGKKSIEIMKNIKKTLDPKLLLNRGNLFKIT